jgi:hypothetical protein
MKKEMGWSELFIEKVRNIGKTEDPDSWLKNESFI